MTETATEVGIANRKARRAAVLALCAPLLGACSVLGIGGGPPPETPQQAAARTADEGRIQREVEARLAAEPSIGAGRVRVMVERGGEVGLHGAVNGFGALRCAIRNAELVRGVRLVIDHMVLEPGPSTVQCLAPRTVAAPQQTAATPP